jgi:hypothetical protein
LGNLLGFADRQTQSQQPTVHRMADPIYYSTNDSGISDYNQSQQLCVHRIAEPFKHPTKDMYISPKNVSPFMQAEDEVTFMEVKI